MSWTSSQQLSELIAITYFQTGSQRKDADNKLRDIRVTAINFGDCLVNILSSDQFDVSMKLAVALMLDGLVGDCWRESSAFSDKPTVMTILTHQFESSIGITPFSNVIVSILSRICVIEFPSSLWEDYIERCILAATDVSLNLLLSMSKMAYQNHVLWQFFWSHIIPAVQRNVNLRQTFIKLAENLVQKIPQQSWQLIPVNIINAALQEMLAINPSTFAHIDGPTDSLILVVHCHHILRGTLRYLTDHRLLLQHTLECLNCTKSSFTRESLEAQEFISELLETAQSIYSTKTEAFTFAEASYILSLFWWYCLDVETIDVYHQDDQTLLQDFLDENSVPTGCGSGSCSEKACSILQLFVEYDQSVAIAFGASCIQIASGLQAGDVDQWMRLSNVCGAIAHQCEVSGFSFVDHIQCGSQLVELLQHGTVLCPVILPHVLYVLSLVLKLSKNVALCSKVFLDVCQLLPSTAASNVKAMAALLIGRLVCASTVVAEQLEGQISPILIGHLLGISSSGGFSTVAALTSLNTFMQLVPESIPFVWSNGGMNGVVDACFSSNAGPIFCEVLKKFFVILHGEHEVPNQCLQFQQLCLLAGAKVQLQNPITSRFIVEIADYVAVSFAEDGCSCKSGVMPIYEYALSYMATGPHDDSTTRCLTKCLGGLVTTLPDQYILLLLSTAEKLVEESCTKTSVAFSLCSLSYGLALIRCKGADASSLLHFLTVTIKYLYHALDLQLTGMFLPVAVSLAFHPEVFDYILQHMRLSQMQSLMQVWVWLFPHLDNRTQHFTLLAWKQLVDHAAHDPQSLTAKLLHSQHIAYEYIRSLHQRFQLSGGAAKLLVIDGIFLTVLCKIKPPAGNAEVIRLRNFSMISGFDWLNPESQLPQVVSLGQTAMQFVQVRNVEHLWEDPRLFRTETTKSQ